jgi:F-type H+-transporting ATPase subunit b
VKRVILGVAAIVTLTFASESGGTDILPRTVNFIIFAAILYYLLSDIIKKFFEDRKNGIVTKLEEVQNRLKEAKRKRGESEEELKKAKKLAEDILKVAQEEAVIIKEKAKENLEKEIKLLKSGFEENCKTEERKVVRGIVKEVLEESFEDKNISLSEEEFAKIIVKKVA